MTSRRRDSEHRQKIRESCNSCSSQKIRCGKQRPACQRCVSKGIECNYSYSQRTGRRAPAAAAAAAAAAAQANAAQHPQHCLPLQQQLSLSRPSLSSANSSTTTSSTPIASFAPPQTPASDCDPFITVRSGSISDQSVMQGMPPFDNHCGDPMSFDHSASALKDSDMFPEFNSGMSLDFLWSPTTETGTTSSLDSHQGSMPNTIHPNAGLTFPPHFSQTTDWQGFQTAVDAPSTSPSLSTGTHSRTSSVPQCHGTQDCLSLALQVVYDLHVSRDACSTAASDPMTCMSATREDARDVDQVLFLNRDAIKSVNKILDCPCSADPSVALACYLAATKIVSWYAAAIGVSDGNPDSMDDGQSMSDRIISRPIFMGSYRLDPEAQRSVRAKVVLTELREHVQPLLAKLPKHQVSSFGRQDHGPNMGMGNSHLPKDNDGQPCALRSQIRRIIREAGSINKTV